MHENFGLVRAIERLLLRGKLDEARNFARAIAISPDEVGLTAWATHAARVRDRAAELANATSLDDAIRREAQLASECASCHVDTGVMPDFSSPPPVPPDRPFLEVRMARHRWAADRLWEGMVGMADDSWRAGLDVLAATPLPAAELGENRQALATKLQRQATNARVARSADRLADRATAYGEMLATCAACHTSTTNRVPDVKP
ncbi:MAG TPA: hypothetical protein VGO00_11545 [Kofleriaceae bacterium]|nr:hypothetical protein [Kofleriaceae bacterium]